MVTIAGISENECVKTGVNYIGEIENLTNTVR